MLRPRSGLIEPAAVDAKAYFSPAQLERTHDFRRPQALLGLLGLGVTGGTLALLALRPPPRMRRGLEWAGGRPLIGAAAAGAGISLLLAAVTLPVDAAAQRRAAEVGLSTQGLGLWLGDVARSAALSALMAAAGAALLVGLARRFPRRWWIPASLATVALSVLFLFAAPVLVAPLFNRFTPLPPGELRSEVLDLARRAGVQVGEVYRVDASRRTTGVNAYVGGLGATKRVVLYDNLIDDFPRDQVRSVVAHELAHQRHRDLYRGLLWLALVAPPAMLLLQRLVERTGTRHSGAERASSGRSGTGRSGTAPTGAGHSGTPTMVPAFALWLAVVGFCLTAGSNALSRQVESAADAFALRLTQEPEAFIALERGLAIRNVADPDPPRAVQLLFGTHPDTLERIGYGVAWKRRPIRSADRESSSARRAQAGS